MKTKSDVLPYGGNPELQPPSVLVVRRYTVFQSDEPGAVISIRDLDRLIARIESCRAGRWGELWLAGFGAGVAVAASTAVGALTLTALVGVLWVCTAAGILIAALCLIGYLIQRGDHTMEIAELRKDLELYKPAAVPSAVTSLSAEDASS